MEEYIRKQDALNIINMDKRDTMLMECEVRRLQPSDVAPVIHAKWIEVNKETKFDYLGDKVVVKSFKCENCGGKT